MAYFAEQLVQDYVYIPLGGNRVSKIKHIRNLLIVWFLTGLWHGAAWNFVAWGLYYGVLLIIEKYLLSPVLDRLPDVVRHIYSIVLVVIGWVLFFSFIIRTGSRLYQSDVWCRCTCLCRQREYVSSYKQPDPVADPDIWLYAAGSFQI